MTQLSRRDFLKLSSLGTLSLSLAPFLPILDSFEDFIQVRVATKSVSVYREPDDRSAIVSQLFRDQLVSVYDEVAAGKPIHNPIWYRVWGGYVHRARLQKVKTIHNLPLNAIPESIRQYVQTPEFMMHEGMDGKHDFAIHLETNDPLNTELLIHVLSDWGP